MTMWRLFTLAITHILRLEKFKADAMPGHGRVWHENNFSLSSHKMSNTQTHHKVCKLLLWSYHVNLCIGVTHVAHSTAILHLIHVLPCDNIFISWKGKHYHTAGAQTTYSEKYYWMNHWIFIILKKYTRLVNMYSNDRKLPVQVMTMSTALMTSCSRTSWKPSMLIRKAEVGSGLTCTISSRIFGTLDKNELKKISNRL